MPHSLEKMYQIWDDRQGDCVEVGPDRDGLDLLEIRYRSERGKIGDRITLNFEQAKMLIQALTDLVDDHNPE